MRPFIYKKRDLSRIISLIWNKKYNTTNEFKMVKRHGKKRGYTTIDRKILVAIYHMFSIGEVWNPTDLASVEKSDKDRIKYNTNNFNNYFH